MQFQRILVPLASVTLVAAAYHYYRWPGVAVVLNAKLRPGVTLLHVVAMTKSLGALQSEKGEQPELYRWTDGSQSHVTCEFLNGKLKKWELVRPVQADEAQTHSENGAGLSPAP
jgi:hypothetical protein